MTITNQDLSLYRGDSAIVFVGLTDAVGDPFDPTTAAAIRYRVATSAHAVNSEALIQKDMDDGITAAEGGVNIVFTLYDTALPPATYYHELKVYDSSLGDVATAMTGSLIIRRALLMGADVQAELTLVGGSDMSGDLTTP